MTIEPAVQEPEQHQQPQHRPHQHQHGDLASQYDEEYYKSYGHDGSEPYEAGSELFEGFFGTVADEIVKRIGPHRVFDAGCAIGFLVAALWDRGVEAHGRDISEFAISQVRSDVRQYCGVGSIADPIPPGFDLVVCVEVLEHLPEDEAIKAIQTMAKAAPRVLFSSTPDDFEEPTHINVRPTLYWLQQFAAAGLAPVLSFDGTFLCPHAILFERSESGRDARDLAAAAEIVRLRLQAAEVNRTMDGLHRQVADLHARLAREEASRGAAEAERNDAVANGAALASKLALAEGRLYAVISLTPTWKVRVLRNLPTPVRRAVRVTWWTMTLQLRDRLRARRAATRQHEVDPETGPRRVADLVTDRIRETQPLLMYPDTTTTRRLSIITDGVSPDYLFGGVGTSIIFGSLLAERLGAKLRLVTRRDPGSAEAIFAVLDANGIARPEDVEVAHIDPLGSERLPLSDQDVFMTTSWWSTEAALRSVDAKRVVYLLQEDERMFYPFGDERLRCATVLDDPRVRFVVNSELLHRHLAGGDEPLAHIAQNGVWFEPAFPEKLFHDGADRRASDGRRRFVFYARPKNLRNLFWLGIEAIDAAIENGVLDPAVWQFSFVGSNLDEMVLRGDVRPILRQNLPWDQYAAVVREADLGLSLMDTPHPSYPPLDLAASGAVVVSNRSGIKTSLEQYSKNILCGPATVEGIVETLRSAVALCDDTERRAANYASAGLQRDWRVTLQGAVGQAAEWLKS